MKYTLLVLILIGNACCAESMKGFGARYYDEDIETYQDEHPTNKDLTPDIIIGSNKYKMELSRIDSIAKHTGVKVNKDNQAAWICLKSKGINYWFISDNEMGNGDLTAIALAKDESPCTPYTDNLLVSVKAPMLTSRDDISSYFVKPKKNIVMYYKDVEKSDYIQSNSIMYYLKGGKVQGMFISQVTTN